VFFHKEKANEPLRAYARSFDDRIRPRRTTSSSA